MVYFRYMTILGKAIIAILLIGGVGGGVYMVTTSMKKDAAFVKDEETKRLSQTTAIEEVKTDTSFSKKTLTEKDMSFPELMKKGGAYECTVKQQVMEISTDGIVYIKDGNVSAKFSTTMQGKVIETSMMTKEGYSYTWTNITPNSGVKTKLAAAVSQEGTSTQLAASYSWNGADIGSYSCVSATVSDAVFTLPGTVTFTEIK